MMAITTSSSISVNPCGRLRRSVNVEVRIMRNSGEVNGKENQTKGTVAPT